MVSLSRTISLGLFVAALGLTRGASGQDAQQQQPPAQRVEAAKPPEKPQAAARSDAPPAKAGIAPEKPKPADKKPKADKPQEGQVLPLGTFADWVIVIFTGVLTWVAWRQHKLETTLAADTGESVALAKKSADAAASLAESAASSIALLRAQIAPQVTLIDGRLATQHHGGPFTAYAVFENGGQTAARNTVVKLNIGYREFPLIGDLPEPVAPTPPSAMTLGAGAKYSADVTMPRALTPEELQSLNVGSGAVFVWGYAEYDGLLGERLRHRFRCFLGGDYGVRPGFTLSPHEDGND